MKRIKTNIKKMYKVITKPEMAILPANMAFYLVMALIPFLTIIIYIASFFSISFDSIVNLVQNFLPNKISGYVIEIISGKGFDSSLGLLNLIVLFVATNGMYAVINASDTLYKVENRDPLKNRIKSIFMLFLIILLFLFLIIVPIFGTKILTFIGKFALFKNVMDELIDFFNLLKWPITFLIIFINLKLIYTISPSKEIKSKDTSSGALFTTIIWMIVTVIFSYYLNTFAKYDIIYGNLSTIVMLMVYLYILSYIFVIGIVINVNNYNEIMNKIKKEEENNKGIQ